MASSPRRTHRKRISALRLSSDTTSTLPEYIGWRELVPPPRYEDQDEADADAADLADEEGDTDEDPVAPMPYIPPTPVSPRSQHHRRNRRRPSSPQQQQDVLLDSLLERSVHALELSNALLQSSMTPTPSTLRDSPPSAAVAVPRRSSGRSHSASTSRSGIGISTSRRMGMDKYTMPPTRIRDDFDEPAWADDLAAIARDVDDLLVSSSLPASVSPVATRKPPRRPSLDPTPESRRSSTYSNSTSYFTRSASPTASTTSFTSASASTTSRSTASHASHSSHTSTGSNGGLRMAPAARQRLVAPAPRALTQYVAAGDSLQDDDGHIALPSTIGLRGGPSEWNSARGNDGLPALYERERDGAYEYHPEHQHRSTRSRDLGMGRGREEGEYEYDYHHRTTRSRDREVRSPPLNVDGLPAPFTFPNPPQHSTHHRTRDRDREQDEWVTVGARDWAPDAASALRSAIGPPPPPSRSLTSPRLLDTGAGSRFSPTLPNIAGSLPSLASLSSLSPKLLGGAGRKGLASPKLGVGANKTGARSASVSRSSSSSRGGTPRRTSTPAPRPHNHNSLSQSTPDLRLSSSTHSDASNFTVHPNSSQIIASLPSEHSPQSSESGSGSGDEGRAKEARCALRKILDEAPLPPPPPPPPRKQFLPRSPPPAAHTAPSTATASVSRLFSKGGGGRHSVSTKPATERVVGIMKGGRNSLSATPVATTPTTPTGTEDPSLAQTAPSNSAPTPTPTNEAGPSATHSRNPSGNFFFGVPLPQRLGMGNGSSKPGSGASTPSAKRISFAELPESYVASTGRPPRSSRSKSKSRASKSKGKSKGKARADGSSEEGADGSGGGATGWLAWLVGGVSAGGMGGMGMGGGMGGMGMGGGMGGMEERESVVSGTGRRGSGVWGMGMGVGVGGRGSGVGEEWAV